MRPVAAQKQSGNEAHPTVLAVIPARYHSTRFPGKLLADLAGRPVIEHVYRRAQGASVVSGVIVATDDERIRLAVERFGGVARLTSSAHRSGTDRLAEVARDLACDIVVNVQGDEPLVEPAAIEEAVAPLAADPTLEMATLRHRVERPAELNDPNVVKVVVDRNDFALYFSRAPIPGAHAGGGPPRTVFKHIGVYAYRRQFLLEFAALAPTPLEQAESLEQLRALEYGYRIKAIETAYDSVGIDTPEDLERARQLVAGVSVRAHL